MASSESLSLEGFQVFRDEIFVRAQVSSAKSKSKLENLVLEKWRTLSITQRTTYAETAKTQLKRKSLAQEEVSPNKKVKLDGILDKTTKTATPSKNIKKEKWGPTKDKIENKDLENKKVKNEDKFAGDNNQFVDYGYVLTQGCPICKTSFKSVQNFSRHTKGKHSVLYINCRKCKMFFKEKEYKEHKCSKNGKPVQVNLGSTKIDQTNEESKIKEQVAISQKIDIKIKPSPSKINKIKKRSPIQEVERIWPHYIDAKILKMTGCPECKQIIKSGKYSLHLMDVHKVQYKFKMKSDDGKIDPKYVLIKKPTCTPTSVKTEPVEQNLDVMEIQPIINPAIIKAEPIEQTLDIVEDIVEIKPKINEKQTKSKKIEKKPSTVNKGNVKRKETIVEEKENQEVEENLLIVQENLLIQEEQIRTVIFQTESLQSEEPLSIETDEPSEADPLCVNDENLPASKDFSNEQNLNPSESGENSDLVSKKIPVLIDKIRCEIRLLLQEAKQKCLQNPLVFSVEEDKDGNDETEEQCENKDSNDENEEIEPDTEGFEIDDNSSKSDETKDLQIDMIEEDPHSQESEQVKANPSNEVDSNHQDNLEPILDMEVTMDNDDQNEMLERLDLNNYKNVISGRNTPSKISNFESSKIIFPNLLSIASSPWKTSKTIISNKNNSPVPKLEVTHPETSIDKDTSAQKSEYNNNKTATKTKKRNPTKNNNKTTKKMSDKLENLNQAVSDVIVYKLTPSEAVVKYKVTHSSLWMELITNQEDREALANAGLTSEEEKKVAAAWDDLVRGLSGVEMMDKYESNVKELMEYVKFMCEEAGREKWKLGEAWTPWWLAFRKKHDLLWRKS